MLVWNNDAKIVKIIDIHKFLIKKSKSPIIFIIEILKSPAIFMTKIHKSPSILYNSKWLAMIQKLKIFLKPISCVNKKLYLCSITFLIAEVGCACMLSNSVWAFISLREEPLNWQERCRKGNTLCKNWRRWRKCGTFWFGNMCLTKTVSQIINRR